MQLEVPENFSCLSNVQASNYIVTYEGQTMTIEAVSCTSFHLIRKEDLLAKQNALNLSPSSQFFMIRGEE
jgi:hypothetical protein